VSESDSKEYYMMITMYESERTTYFLMQLYTVYNVYIANIISYVI